MGHISYNCLRYLAAKLDANCNYICSVHASQLHINIIISMSNRDYDVYVRDRSWSRISSGTSFRLYLSRVRSSMDKGLGSLFIARHFSSEESLRVNSIEYRWCLRRVRTGVCKLLLGYRNVCTFRTHLTPLVIRKRAATA